MKKISHKTAQQGFTIVETVVTLVVLSVFLFSLFQTYMVVESQRLSVARQARASDIAYSNLRKVAARPTQLTIQVCNTNAAQMDLTAANPSAETGLDITQYGYALEPVASVKQDLGSNATQTLVAYAPAGCTNLLTSPIKVVSTVTYGYLGDKVSHARYIK